jgi:sortase (surface protein transpeptidase)
VGLALAGPTAAAPHGATLIIPRLDLYTRLAPTLNQGPYAYYQDEDTLAIAAHRTTHSRPFARLPELRPGDKISVDGVLFVVRRTAIVRPWQTWILRYRGVVLSACHPAGSAAYRYVVFAAPV